MRFLAATLLVISVALPGLPAVAAATCVSSVGPGLAPPSSVATDLPGFHAAWYGQSGYMSLCPGEVGIATVAYINTGSLGWYAGVPGQTAYLGTSGPEPGQDRPSRIGGDGTRGSPQTGWPSYNRLAMQPSAYVGPGQVAWFQFRVKAPASSGTYRIALRPLIEGTQWMEDYGVFWVVSVPRPDGSPPPLVPPLLGERNLPAGSLQLTSAMSVLANSESGSSNPSIGVGPSSFVVTTTSRTLIRSKDGTLIADESTLVMFTPVSGGLPPVDMRVLFDERSGRFFVVGATMPPCTPGACTTTWVVAVSKTGTPGSLGAGDWYLYGFDGSLEGGVPSGQKGDFNVISLTEDKLILTGVSIPPAGPAYAKIYVFDRAPFLAGAPVSAPIQAYTRLRDPSADHQFEKTFPAVNFGSVRTAFLVSWSRGCSIGVVGITGPPGTAQLKVHSTGGAGDCSGPILVPQLGGGVALDAFPQIVTPPVYRDGHLWLVQSIYKTTPTGRVGALRLVELDVSRWPDAPIVVADSTFFEEGVWYFNAALTVDPDHNVAIVANRSSPREFGSLWLTGRRASDPPGTFRPAVAVKHGEAHWNWARTSSPPASQTRNWFSGWSSAATDPIDGSGWVLGQTTRTSCEWELWVGRTDYRPVEAAYGSAPAVAAPDVLPVPCGGGPQPPATPIQTPSAAPAPAPSPSPAPSPPAGTPRPPTASGGFAVRFMEQLPPGSTPERPDDIAVGFGITGFDLGTLRGEETRRLIVGQHTDWTASARYPLILLLPGTTPAGEYQLVLRLPDGREASTPYTVARR